MLAQIVVLYMTFALNMPAWCKVLVCISLSVKIAMHIVAFLNGVYKAINESKDD